MSEGAAEKQSGTPGFLSPPAPVPKNGSNSDSSVGEKLGATAADSGIGRTEEYRRRRHTMDKDSRGAAATTTPTEHRFFRRSVICDSNATALELPGLPLSIPQPSVPAAVPPSAPPEPHREETDRHRCFPGVAATLGCCLPWGTSHCGLGHRDRPQQYRQRPPGVPAQPRGEQRGAPAIQKWKWQRWRQRQRAAGG